MEKWIGSRISYVDAPKQCTIIIEPKRNRLKESILFAWLIGYTCVGLIMIYYLLYGMDTIDNSQIEGDPEEVIRNQQIYLIVFLGFWAYF